MASYESVWDGQVFKGGFSEGLMETAMGALDRITDRVDRSEYDSEDYQLAKAEEHAATIQARVEGGELVIWEGIPAEAGSDAVEQVRFRLRDLAHEYDDGDYQAIAEQWKASLDYYVDINGRRDDSVEGLLINNDEALRAASRDFLSAAIRDFDATANGQ